MIVEDRDWTVEAVGEKIRIGSSTEARTDCCGEFPRSELPDVIQELNKAAAQIDAEQGRK